MTGQALVVQADALRLPLPDESVDLVVTSPPYFALRAYDAGPGQLGSEPTPQAYLEALWQATREMARVLKPSGSIFINLGDKYSGNPSSNGGGDTLNGGRAAPIYQPGQGQAPYGVRAKSLMLLPERYRIGCVDHLGLIARAVIVWNKPNGLPESVTDRVRRSHEDWVHLVKQPRYYAAVDEIREERAAQPYAAGIGKPERATGPMDRNGHSQWEQGINHFSAHPLGKLPGSVWTIPSEPLRLPEHLGVSHYAAFSSEWPRRLILGWSPPGVCVACGQGRWPVVDRRFQLQPDVSPERNGDHGKLDASNRWGSVPRGSNEATILGYACACTPHTNHPGTGGGVAARFADGQVATVPGNAPIQANSGGLWNQPKVGPWREYHLAGWTPPPTRPAVVADVFGGTGTTAMVARALGRIGISIDLSFAYGRAARWRIRHDAGKAISRTWTERQGQLL